MFFRLIQKLLEVVLRHITIYLIITVTIFVLVDVFARYIMQKSVTGLSEVTLVLVMWLYMLGAAVASDKNTHLHIDIVPQILKRPMSIAIYRFIRASICLVIVCFFVIWAFELLSWGIRRHQVTPILFIPYISSQVSIFVVSLLFLFYYIRDVLKAATDIYRLTVLSKSYQP